jgi:shikimate kinase
MNLRRAIVLIGFMGAGKSSVGLLLARRLNVPRFDTDELVAERLGMPITEIFDRFGESAFRDAETQLLRELPLATPAMVVTGGGTVLRQENVDILRSHGIFVYLAADEETLYERASRSEARPLLQTSNPQATLKYLLAVRAPVYAAVSDVTIETSSLNVEQLADEIMRQLENDVSRIQTPFSCSGR